MLSFIRAPVHGFLLCVGHSRISISFLENPANYLASIDWAKFLCLSCPCHCPSRLVTGSHFEKRPPCWILWRGSVWTLIVTTAAIVTMALLFYCPVRSIVASLILFQSFCSIASFCLKLSILFPEGFCDFFFYYKVGVSIDQW